MIFLENVNSTISKPRILIQLNVAELNLQWINIGAGIWYVNFDNLYPEVDSSLLDGFTAQTFGEIGSVLVDGIQQQKATTLLSLTNDNMAYYFDSSNKELYICLENYDSPLLHNILLGVVYGYSLDEFTPIDSSIMYEGRLISNPSISIARDPLFFGKIQYSFSGFDLINSDGSLDTFAQNNNIYGNTIKILFGYEDISINDYIQLYSGIANKVVVGEDIINFSIGDKRNQLTKSITYSCTDKNALDAIVEILEINYGVVYDNNYYNITEWEKAKAIAPNITINVASGKGIDDIKVNELIELICSSVFGLFIVDSDDRYNFKIINTATSLGDIGPAGGIIFYIDTTQKNNVYYEIANDEYNSIPWSNITDTAIGSTESAIGTGADNTLKIIAQAGHTTSASLFCENYSVNGYSDWYLPSLDELKEVYNNKSYIGSIVSTYNSSTEYSASRRSCIYMVDGVQYNWAKSVDQVTRPIRSFTYPYIDSIDILNSHKIEYDPSEVISSTKVGYNKNWNEGYTSPYTWFYSNTTDEGKELEVESFIKYKTYNQKEFMTVLVDTSALTTIQAFSNTVLDYSKDVHGIGEIIVPMKYYEIDLGDIVDIEINRPTSTMLGTKKCEIIGKTYNLSSLPTITFKYRII